MMMPKQKGEIFMNAPAEVAENYLSIGVGKVKLPLGKMFLLGIMAGAFIALAGVGASTASASVTIPSIAKLVSALVFPAGLAMVILAGSELFTGNCLLIIPLLSGKVSVGGVLRNWVIVYLGNLVGSLAVSALVVYSHQLSNFSGALAVSTISTSVAKCSMSFGDAFLRGVGCNFLVCIAVWIAFAAKDVTGKLVGLYLPIMLFVVSGFEHSVANMFYGPVGLFAMTVPTYAAAAADAGINTANLTWGNFIVSNLVPVTLGNIVGGCAVGAIYWACYLRKKKESPILQAPTAKKGEEKKESVLSHV
jgi:formate/nitrite transporter